MVHPQKRLLLRTLLDSTIGRIIELKVRTMMLISCIRIWPRRIKPGFLLFYIINLEDNITLKILKETYIQGLQEVLTQSKCLLPPKYEYHGLLMPTRGSPDVVHLVICASQVSWCTFWITISLVSREHFFEDASISVIFSIF